MLTSLSFSVPSGNSVIFPLHQDAHFVGKLIPLLFFFFSFRLEHLNHLLMQFVIVQERKSGRQNKLKL